MKVARQRAEEAGVADRVKFELIDYRARSAGASTASSRSACSSMSAPRTYGEFFAKCRELLGRRRRDAAAHHRQVWRGRGARPVHRQVYLPGLSPAVASADGHASSEKMRLIASDIEILRAPLCLHLAPLAAADRRRRRRRSSRSTTSASSDVGILSRRRRSSMFENGADVQLTRSSISATAAPCRSPAITWARPRRAIARPKAPARAQRPSSPPRPGAAPGPSTRPERERLARLRMLLAHLRCMAACSSGVMRPSWLASAMSKC